MLKTNTRLRLGAVALAAGAVTLAMVSPAAAHVTVSSPDASPGGFGKVTFRVPTESDTASTVKVSVALPADTPFAFVSAKVKPGWTIEQKTEKLDTPVETGGFTISKAVTTVTWTATRQAAIGPGEFDEFDLSVGPFADDVDELAFPTTQMYSDGEIVHWDEPTPADGTEPENPAPTLSLTGGAGAGHDDGGDDEANEPTVQVSGDDDVAAADSPATDDGTARALGIGGLVLGALALMLAAIGLRGRRSDG